MTVIRKRTGDKGGCCNPYSELQLEIERVDQTAIDAKTSANDTEAYLNTINGKVNEAIAVIPQVQTNTENISIHQGWLSENTTDINKNRVNIQEQSKDIAALKTKTNDNTAAIEALENEVGPETVAGTIQYRLQNIDTKLPTAIKEVEMIADASTVTHKATHISGTAESDALPVVSREQAGIMSASVYAAMEDVIANNTSRISVLEQSAPTYDISGLVGPNPTNAEISAAFTQRYPNVPIQAGLRSADYDNAHFWQYGKGTWIILTQIDVQVATNQSLGIVKGSNTDGKMFVETDGSMSLKGYDALVSKDSTHDSKISTLEVGLGNANARIDATNTNVANNAQDIVTANGNISTNTNDINGLKGRMATAEGQIATHETKLNQHTQSINGLTTNVNGLKGRMTTAEGQIATHETKIDQQTQSINGLTTDVNTLKQKDETLEGTINQHTQSINELSTNVNNLNTSKQDKLTAGENITIQNNIISAESYIPVTRIIEGADSIFNEFKLFLENAKMGDEFGVFQYTTTDFTSGSGLDKIIKPRTSGIVRFRDSSTKTYFDLEPWAPIRMIREYTIPYVSGSDGKLRTFCYEGACQIRGDEDPNYSRQHGQIYFSMIYGSGSTTPSYVNVAAFDYTKEYNSSAKQAKRIGVIIENSITSDKESYFAIVNYE